MIWLQIVIMIYLAGGVIYFLTFTTVSGMWGELVKSFRQMPVAVVAAVLFGILTWPAKSAYWLISGFIVGAISEWRKMRR